MIRSHTADESSVVFNLRQLMQLEEQRLQAEADAQRAQVLAAERTRRDAEARALELAREQALDAERRQAEREAAALRVRLDAEAATLRVRLDAEAAERTERERLAFDHERQLYAAKLAAGRRRAGIAAVALCAAGLAVVIVRALPAATPAAVPLAPVAGVEELRRAAVLVDEQERELRGLRAQIEQLRTRAEPAASASTSPPAKHKSRAQSRQASVVRGASGELDPLADDPSEDPIKGL